MTKRLLFSLMFLAFMSVSAVSTAQIVLLDEPFTYGVTPTGWTQDSAGVTPFYPWTFDNQGLRAMKGSADTTYAIFDSDHYAQGNSQNCYLNLPSLDASALSDVLLILKEVFRSYTASYHQIEVSVDGGSTWSHLLGDSTSNVGGISSGSVNYPDTLVTNVYDITSLAAGQSDVRIRFHYVGTWGYYWVMDNVKVTDFYACTAPPVAGQTVSARPFSCNTDSFLLSLSHNSSGSGQTYQWRSSTDGLTWNDMVGDTNNTALASQSGPMYYQCVLTCSTFAKTSDSILVSNQPPVGSALSSDPYTCDSTYLLSLSLSSTLPDYGQIYQWQSSPDGLSWTNIAGATLDTAVASQSNPTYYRCQLTCESTNANSDSAFVDTHPDPGSTVSADFYVCNASQNLLLSLSNTITVAGITYSWESSQNGVSWNSISGATNDSVNVTQSSGTFYRCVVGCGLSSGPSDSIYIGSYNLGGLTCYCTALTSATCSGDYISNVTITGTTLNNNTTCLGTPTNNYTFMPPIPTSTANLTRGMTYSISITTSSDNIISMWIDYNGDGVYDASEWNQICTTSTAGVATTISFTVPIGAIVGEVGMRIRSRAVGNQNGAADACLEMFSGESEDYVVGIETNVGLNAGSAKIPFMIAPNPASGWVKITSGTTLSSKSILRVLDVLGNELQHVLITNAVQFELDLSSLANGIYFINLGNDTESQTRRLVINR